MLSIVTFLTLYTCVQSAILDLQPGYLIPSNATLNETIPLQTESSARASGLTLAYFKQKLDHFDKNNKETWGMRYLANDVAFDGYGPIYIFVGGSQNIMCLAPVMTDGLMYSMAQENNGYLFLLEHRFYGDSIPSKNLRLENLDYLSIEQAIEDIVYFIRKQKKRNPNLRGRKVVLVSGGYGANLAAWTREKYPRVVDAVIMSSAPLDHVVDFKSFYVDAVSRYPTSECINVIMYGLGSIYYLIQFPEGQEQIISDFRFCNGIDFHNRNDFRTFLMQLISTVAIDVVSGTTASMQQACRALTKPETLDDYARFARYIRKKYTCFMNYKDMISILRQTTINEYSDFRSIYYQKCTQLGQFQTIDHNILPIEYFYQICKDSFGATFTPEQITQSVSQTNLVYGGLHTRFTRVVATRGTLDPFGRLMLSCNSSSVPLLIFKGTSHGADIDLPTITDSVGLKTGRRNIRKIINYWISS